MSNNLIGELGKANNEIGRMHPGPIKRRWA